jgi:iron complex outermembrane receptor protein
MKLRSHRRIGAIFAMGMSFGAAGVHAEDLGSALVKLGRDSGRDILFSADVVQGREAAAVPTNASVEQALTAMLSGTGLRWRNSDAGTIIIDREDEVEPEEIVVTAQRRDERGQAVPISVTGFGPNAIENYRLERLRDISRVTPGLLVSSFSQSSPTIAIRGASNTFTQIGVNRPVAVVVDDVFVPRNSAADFELFGLNSIQILRGPQGTLFGRNVTGGAIVLDTGRPQYAKNAAQLRLTSGDYSAHAIEGLGDVALGDRVAMRVAGAFREHDGYGRDRLTNREQDDQDSINVRTQVRMQLASTLELLLGADYGNDENGGRTLSSIGAGDDADRRTSELGIPQNFERTQRGGSARLSWQVGAGEVTSITALRDSETAEVYSNVGANFAFLSGTQSQLVTSDADDVRAFTQEVRYASALTDYGSFVAGAYYLDEEASRLLRTQAFAARTGALVTNQATDQAVDSRSVAGFVDTTINLPAELRFTVGVRYTNDRKTASLVRNDRLNAAGSFSAGGLEKSWEKWTPRAVLSWNPVEQLHTYVSYSQGYTAGGFNTDATIVAALRRPFDPETVTNYELGVKTDWWRDRLRVNASAFHLKYEDKQELFFDNVTRILNIYNAASATSDGFELETRLQAAKWLTLNASYGLLDTNYDEFVIPGGAVYTGNPLSSSPHDKVSVSANVAIPVGDWGEITGMAMYSSTSSYFTGASADAGLRVPAYDLVNLSVGLASVDERWSVTAFVRNATDTEYLLTPSTQTVRAEYLGEPRTLGVSVTWSF